MAKATLYTFPMSVWAAVPELALIELGYSDDQVQKKVINLVEGENFDPAFVKLNPNGTLPTLETPSNVYTSTAEVTKYLVEHASVKVAPGTELIGTIHDGKLDPNFPMLLSRNENELNTKSSGFVKTFLQNRQKVLEKHSTSSFADPYDAFYKEKLSSNGSLLELYANTTPLTAEHQAFFSTSTKHVENIRAFILNDLPSLLSSNTTEASPFLGGERPGEDDFHLGAWLARVVSVQPEKERDVEALEADFLKGQKVPSAVKAYFEAWEGRESWKVVYKDGLH